MEKEQQKDLRILILENSPTDAELMERELRKDGLAFTSRRVDTREAFVQTLEEFKPEVILADYKLPEFDGMTALRIVRQAHPQVPVIMVTGVLTDVEAVELIQTGARDYVLKDRLARLAPAIKRVLNEEKGIRERKLNEKIILEDQKKLTAIINSSLDAVVQMDADGIITGWSNQAAAIFGWTSKEAISQLLCEIIIPPQYREAHTRGLERFLASGESHILNSRIEIEGLHRDGHKFPVELSVTSITLGDKIEFSAFIRDITQRKLFEKQLHARLEKIASLNVQLMAANKQLAQVHGQLLQSEKMASIGLLAAGVAHEINNPIGYVNSNLGTLEKYLADIFALMNKYEQAETLMDCHDHELEELRRFKQKIDLAYLRKDTKALLAESQQGLERVKKIVIDLKDFSRTGAAEEWAWADIQQGLESTLNVVWNELKYKCEVEKEYATLPQIYCMPSQLNQVFMNLLVNAAQAIEEYGIITIRTGQENDQVWVEVADTGKGVAAEDLPHLFDPFFTTKPAGQGTGLGLSVSYSIVEKHHGRIEVKSEIGKGTAFRVWLPVEHAGQD